MSDDIKVGDQVEWSSSGGKSVGRVKKKLTKPMDIKGHHVAASPDNPELLVKSDKGGGEAAHKPASVKKLTAKPPANSSAKKTAPKKASAKKAAPKKATAKKTTAKKASGTKSASKKATKR